MLNTPAPFFAAASALADLGNVSRLAARCAEFQPRLRSVFRLCFVDQPIGDHADPIGEGDERGQIEHQLGPVATATVGQVDQHKLVTIIIDHRRYFELAQRMDPQSRRHFWHSLLENAQPAASAGPGQ